MIDTKQKTTFLGTLIRNPLPQKKLHPPRLQITQKSLFDPSKIMTNKNLHVLL